MEQDLGTYTNGDKAILAKWPWLAAVKWSFDKVGLPILLILFGLGVWTGWIPSPMMDMAQAMTKHVEQTEVLIQLLGQAVSK